MKEEGLASTGGSIGLLESQILDSAANLRKPGITLQEAAVLVPDLPRRSVQEAIQRLEQKRKLVRVARARYFLPGQDAALVACHVFPPSYVSFVTVLHDAGFTEQIPRRLDLAYARAHLHRASWQGLPLLWHPIPPGAFRGYRQSDSGVLEATVAKAAADLIHRQKDFGGITRFRDMVTKALDAAKESEFQEAASAYADRPATVRRILYLRFSDGLVPSKYLQLLSQFDLHNPIELDIARPSNAQPSGSVLRIRAGATP